MATGSSILPEKNAMDRGACQATGQRVLWSDTVEHYRLSLVAQTVKDLLAMQETWVWSLGWKDPLEKGMVTYSSILACGILLQTEEPGRLQSMGSQRVRHDWATNTFTTTFTYIQWNITPAIRRNKILSFVATWVDLETEWSNSDKERKMSYNIAYV